MQNVTFFILFLLVSCNPQNPNAQISKKASFKNEVKVSNENIYEVVQNIPTPTNYCRNEIASNSFAYWLRQVSLKKDKSVYLYNHTLKANQSAQFAVLNVSVGNKDLQQCADAVIRLRAEYLFSQNEMNKISFTDNEKNNYSFSKPFTREHFIQYLDKVFAMCGTASLSQQLTSKNNFNEIEIGDVIIRGGFPGHAVIVMDVAQNANKKKIFLLAQSYMPAQDIHILKNENNKDISPWYKIPSDEIIKTPEYIFYKNELKTW